MAYTFLTIEIATQMGRTDLSFCHNMVSQYSFSLQGKEINSNRAQKTTVVRQLCWMHKISLY